MSERTSPLSKTPLLLLCALIACALWGSAIPFIKLSYAQFRIDTGNPGSLLLFAGVRFMLAGAMVLAVYSAKERRAPLPAARDWPRIALISLFQTAMQYFCYYLALRYTSGVTASILVGTNTFFSILIAALIFRMEPLTARKLTGCAVGFAGVVVSQLGGGVQFAFSLRGKPVYKLILLGIVQPVAYFIFENYGILYTSSAVAGTIIAVVPVCCILMDVLVLHEKVTRRQVLCAVGAVGGVALISAGGAVMISALGLLFLLLTMLSDTVYYGISHSAAKVFTPFEMTYVMFLVGMAAFIPAALFQTGGLHSELITVPAQSGQFWLAVVYLGVLSSGVAYGLLNFANSHLTVSESSLFSNVTTVVSVLAGVILLKEPFSLWQILGVAVILVCVFIANVSASSEK